MRALASALLLAVLALPAAAQTPTFKTEVFATTKAADANLLSTSLTPGAGAGGATRVTTYSATISIVTTATRVRLTATQGVTTVNKWLNFGDDVPADTETVLTWLASSSTTYNLQLEDAATVSLVVVEVPTMIARAGPSGGGGGLPAPGTSGYVLTSNGTGVAPSYQAAGGNVVDTLAATLGAGANGNDVDQSNLGTLVLANGETIHDASNNFILGTYLQVPLVTFGTAPNIKSLASGSSDPESSYAAEPGSIYCRNNGTVYWKTSGSGSTGWSAVGGPNVVDTLSATLGAGSDGNDVDQTNLGSLTLAATETVTAPNVTASTTFTANGIVTLNNSRYLHTWALPAAAAISPIGSAVPVWAAFTTRNGRTCLAFDPTTLEAVDFETVVPATYNGGTLTVSIDFAGGTATSGNVIWAAQVERVNDGALDTDSTSFASAQSSSGTACSATSGILTTATITFTQSQADGALPGDLIVLRVYRDTANASDTMTGDAQLFDVRVRE